MSFQYQFLFPFFSPLSLSCSSLTLLAAAGKTSLIRAFCKAPFEPEGAPTHGVELRVYKAMIGDELMELQILDATGNPLLRGSYDPFYSVVEGVFIVYDASDASAPAEEALDSWMAEVAPYSFLQPLIVGNKADTAEQVAAADERGKAIMERYGVPHIAVSCKENINIDEAFLILLQYVNLFIGSFLACFWHVFGDFMVLLVLFSSFFPLFPLFYHIIKLTIFSVM